jgi:hypothetical protein
MPLLPVYMTWCEPSLNSRLTTWLGGSLSPAFKILVAGLAVFIIDATRSSSLMTSYFRPERMASETGGQTKTWHDRSCIAVLYSSSLVSSPTDPSLHKKNRIKHPMHHNETTLPQRNTQICTTENAVILIHIEAPIEKFISEGIPRQEADRKLAVAPKSVSHY